MRTVPVLTYYLELKRKPPIQDLKAPMDGVTFERAKDPTIEEYKALYTSIGRSYGWYDRILVADDELLSILKDPGVEIFLLRVDGEIAGYCELDRRNGSSVEIAFLGLKGDYQGKGLGLYLLIKGLKEAWKEGTERVWLHTCEWDHEGALPMYEKAGFSLFKRDYHDQKVPDDHEYLRAVIRQGFI